MASRRYVPVSRYPAVARDLAIVVDQGVPASSLTETIESAASLLASVEVFDVYRGDELGAHRKSVAFTLSFRSDRTLTDEEVDAEIEQIVSRLEAGWNARLRAK